MANSFGLSDEQERVLAEIMEADGADFSALVSLAGLDPLVDFRGADLRGVDFGRSDLQGYDFSNADISGCRFDRARLNGAIFANNRDEGTVWPRPRSERQPPHAVLRATTDIELRPFQREAIWSIVAALKQGVERPVIIMPPGTGRTGLLAALLSELESLEVLGVALIYLPTRSAVEQLRRHFSQSFGSDAVAVLKPKELQVPFDARLIVVGSYSLRMDKSAYPPTRTVSGVTHIIAFDGAMTSSRLRHLQSLYPGVQIVGFADSRPTAEKHRSPLVADGEIVFELSYAEAVSAELLEPTLIHGYRWRGSLADDEEEEIGLIMHEVTEVLRSMPSGAVGGIVCRNTTIVQELARELNDSIDILHGSRSGILRVVQHTSQRADESLMQAALDLPGTVLLMNDVVASNFDWAALDYAIVFARLRSPEHLAFVRRRPGRRQGLQVFDYMQNFDWLVS